MFCQYCGSKLAFDISSEDLVKMLKEKEVTKRKEMDIEEQKRKDKESDDFFKIFGIGLIIAIIVLFILLDKT